jgi:hypothetical protein
MSSSCEQGENVAVVEFVESVEFVGFGEFIGFQWRDGRDCQRLMEISGDGWRYILNPNAKAQMTNKVQMPECQRAWRRD